MNKATLDYRLRIMRHPTTKSLIAARTLREIIAKGGNDVAVAKMLDYELATADMIRTLGDVITHFSRHKASLGLQSLGVLASAEALFKKLTESGEVFES